MAGYKEDAATALASGAMLRECLRYEELARVLLAHEDGWLPFFSHIALPAFDVASDAFSTFRELLTKHKVPRLPLASPPDPPERGGRVP